MTLFLFSKALGWALINSLWQFGFLWMVCMLVMACFKNLSSTFKHALALLLSLAGLTWFVFGMLSDWYNGNSMETGMFDLAFSTTYSGAYLIIQQWTDTYLSYLTYAYLIITGIHCTKFILSLHRSHTICTAGLSKAQVELRFYVQKMASHLSISRSVRVFISAYVDTPLVIGFLKPTILIPLACINQLSVPQLEAILLHELAHIKRNDYLVNIYVAAMDIIFFFNPFARLLLGCIKSEREHSCDDWVMQYQFDPHMYASALLTLEQNRAGYFQTAIAATGVSRKILLHRVQRIMNVRTAEKNIFVRTTTCLVAVCIICLFAGMRPVTVTHTLYDYSRELYAIAGKFSSLKKKAVHEQQVTISNQPVALLTAPATPKTASLKPEISSSEPDDTEEPIFPVSINEEVSNTPFISNIPLSTQVLNTENRNFSIPVEIEPELPAAAIAYNFPYVPPSSFYFSTDTAKPRIKAETYRERNARESLLKAKKALNEINWSAIEKTLSAKVNITILKKEIEKSIEQLNWQLIDEAVKDSVERQTTNTQKAALDKEFDEFKKYKNQQQQYELLQNRLQLDQKTLKTDIEYKAVDVLKQLTKHKIVVYL